MKTIEIEFNTDGSFQIEAKGYTGTSCKKATEFLEKELGKVKTVQHKPEYGRKEAKHAKQS